MSWVVLFLLLGINVHNQWTRAMVYYLVSFKIPKTEDNANKYMNIDLNFEEEQYSILASFGFTALYTFCSLIAGRASDKGNRAFIVLVAAAGWSLATAGQGISRSFEQVLAFRSLMGVSQAFTNPPAYGLIASSFPESQIATANSVFASAVYIGGALASLSILADQQVGWRMTCLGSGALGCLLAAGGAFFLRDPRMKREDGGQLNEQTMLLGSREEQEEVEEAASSSFNFQKQMREGLEAIKGVLSIPSVQVLFAASAVRFCAGYGIGVWKAPLYRELFPSSESEFSVANAFVISCGGVLSSLLGGVLADRLAPHDYGKKLLIPAVGSILAVPFWIGACKADSISLLFLEYIVAECWFGPTLAALFKSVPREIQGTAQGLFSVLGAIGNIMPVVIGR
ncbi:hypothetical protein GUITHDRAFT_111436 [Guillardia theta CCMP2712]|uniref:Major facilitator superfamily (MFS) profile domain-containing protein n=1 Tax=Guillardia theta (strain CCMP2712) TaxID=905079 RepID=L1J1Q9_GUITC|nr:hypothetical protein GUITHDRAFT_111436 [Guillardia theta CCMP2712]EKX42463.1 hypothetical protein GUITHDRAFT_111436 [Guillardia theta CCMP2712]|eukprot:XP_005829443.1 hypothetical protein GUITHDRAFT_111436 [Guillardia theta CCMP2712]